MRKDDTNVVSVVMKMRLEEKRERRRLKKRWIDRIDIKKDVGN